MEPRRQNIVTMFPYRQAADGCPLCVICGAELRRLDGLPRRVDSRYCSGACRDDARVRRGDIATIRGLLLERDHGVCRVCGRDCVALEHAFEGWLGPFSATRDLYYRLPAERQELWEKVNRLARRLYIHFSAQIVALGWRADQHTWEAHHVLPVVEGGGGCGLEGYETLCRQCHKCANAELATRRAAQGQIPLPFA